jgi:hypothetical protein
MPSQVPTWVLYAPAVTAVAAAFAACFAAWNAWNARRASNANVLLNVLRDYRSEEVRQAIRRLQQFRSLSNHRDGFAADYAQRVEQHNPDADELDGKRRLLSSFFNSIRALCENGLLDEDLAADALGRQTLEFAIETLGPLDAAHAHLLGGGRDNVPYFRQMVARQFPGG